MASIAVDPKITNILTIIDDVPYLAIVHFINKMAEIQYNHLHSDIKPENNYNGFVTKIFGGGASTFTGKISAEGKIKTSIPSKTKLELRKNYKGFCDFMQYMNEHYPAEAVNAKHTKFQIYRAISMSNDKIVNLKSNEKIEFYLPCSTTSDFDYATEHSESLMCEGNSKVIFVFNVSTAYPLLYMSIPDEIKKRLGEVSFKYSIDMKHRLNEDQKEIVIPPGQYTIVNTIQLADILYVELKFPKWGELCPKLQFPD